MSGCLRVLPWQMPEAQRMRCEALYCSTCKHTNSNDYEQSAVGAPLAVYHHVNISDPPQAQPGSNLPECWKVLADWRRLSGHSCIQGFLG